MPERLSLTLDAPRTHERSDLRSRAILWVAAGLIATILVVGVGLRLFAGAFEGHRAALPQPTGIERAAIPAPQPRLQADPVAELGAQRRLVLAELQGYGWVDRQAGIARIPIDQAMALLVERGWPQPAPALDR